MLRTTTLLLFVAAATIIGAVVAVGLATYTQHVFAAANPPGLGIGLGKLCNPIDHSGHASFQNPHCS